jgi:hypothetical protein
MVNYSGAKIVGLFMPKEARGRPRVQKARELPESRMNEYLRTFIRLGLIREIRASGGIRYEVTEKGLRFIDDYESIMEDLRHPAGPLSGETVPRHDMRFTDVLPRKTRFSKNLVKSRLTQVIELADSVVRGSRKLELILRKGSERQIALE